MTFSNKNINNFSGGEATIKMQSRSDLPVFPSVHQWIQNFIAFLQGPLSFRPGTLYVNHTRLGGLAYFIPFTFNDSQSYLLEFSNGFIRFYKNGGAIVNNPTNITGITNANPAVVTSVAHGYTTGAEVYLSSIGGMTQVDGNYYVVTVLSADTYSLQDIFGNNIDSTTFGVYTSGGTAQSIYEITSPYAIGDVPLLMYTQNADVMYIVHRGYAPMKLVRSSDTSWVIGTFSRTADPFTGAGNWPGAISFTSDGRLCYGGTTDNPETFWGSMAPASDGSARYDDFTLGSLSVNAYQFTLAPLNGQVDSIRFISHTNTYMVMGTYGSLRQLYGAALGQAVTPLAVTVVPIDSYGAAPTLPAVLGVSLLYIQKNFRKLRSVEFNIYTNAYDSIDKLLVSEEIGDIGISKVVVQHSNIDVIWAVGLDGNLYGMTFDVKAQQYAWHRHILGGDATLIDIGILYQGSGLDQLWMIVQREINGHTVCYIEYISGSPVFVDPLQFFTATTNQTSDLQNYTNVLYEQQKTAVHMDASTIYDGSAVSDTVTMTPSPGTMTASSAFFTPSMVGQQIWKKYDPFGQGGGRFSITGYTSDTIVTGTFIAPFDNMNTIPVGYWFLTSQVFTGLGYLEGETVSIVADGNIVPPSLVVNGSIDIGYNASYVQFGLPYTGLIHTFPLDQGGTSGPAQAKIMAVAKLAIRLSNTVGLSYGTNDPYNVEPLNFKSAPLQTDVPTPLFTGLKWQTYGRDQHEMGKSVVLVQDQPLPCTVHSIDVFADVSDEL